MKKGIIIGKGWIGSKLEKFLGEEFEITTTKRKSDANNCFSIDFDFPIEPLPTIKSNEFVVITIPFGKRNSEDELINRFNNLIHFLNNYSGQIILISSTGIYPSQTAFINENTFSDSELISPYIVIENLLIYHFPQITILRLGGIMGDDRFLSKYLDLNHDGLDDVVNHVHLEDILNVIKTCIEQEIKGKTFNIVAPEHPSKREVLEYQINQKLIQLDKKKGKTISSEKLIIELNYQFIFPNPIFFKE